MPRSGEGMRNNMQENDNLLVEQKILGKKGMIGFIALCNMIPPISTDMYLPALPSMAVSFSVTESVMNLTMVFYFLFFAIGILLFGPVSDKYGRRRIITGGILIYIAGCILCAFSTGIAALIVCRIIQAIGGCMVAVSTAMVKDQFAYGAQGSVLSAAQIMGVLGPVAAPVLGAWVIRLSGWRACFVVQAGVAVVTLVMVMLMAETLLPERRLKTGIMKTFTRLGVLLHNGNFTVFLFAANLTQIFMMAYVTVSSYIYINDFGTSQTVYSLFMAGTALVSVIGPIIYSCNAGRSIRGISYTILITAIVFGVVMLLCGRKCPLAFALSFAPAMMANAAMRPFAIRVLLNQRADDSGSASSLFNFVNSLFGTFGMWVVTAVWSDYITGVGMLILITGSVSLVIMMLLFGLRGADVMDPKRG